MHYIFITYNYKLCYQEMVKNMLLHMEFDIEYINILEKLSKDNFPYKTIKKNEENLIFYFENLYLGMGRKFLNNFTLTENLFFNGNMIFNYKDIENIFDINHLEITTIQRIKLKIQILNDLSYEGFLNNEKFFYLDNHNEHHIILYKRLLDELYPIVSKPILESKKFWCNKKYMVEIFLDKISGFLESFITNIINLDYGTHSSNIVLTIYNFYSKYEWIEKYLPNLVKQSINPEIKIEFITISEYPEITDIKYYRESSIDKFKNSELDLYLTIDTSHFLEKNTLNQLYCQQQYIIVPLLEQYGTRFTNMWTDIEENGYYKGSKFYDKIINQTFKGLCNVPYFNNTCLISSMIKDNYDLGDIYKYNKWMDTDLDMGVCENIRNMDLQIWLNTNDNFGEIIKLEHAENIWEKFNETSSQFDLYLLNDSKKQWEKRFIQKDIYENIIENVDGIVINEPVRDLFNFDFFTPLFCSTLIDICNSSNSWSSGKNEDERIDGGYENVPTQDIHMNQLDLHDVWATILDTYISKIVRFLYSNFETKETNIIFVVRYSMDGQKDLRPHHDSSSYTVLFKLNSEFEGGGTHFLRQNYKSDNGNIGSCTMHPGRLTHHHSGIPITSGERYLLVGFIY